MVAATLVLIALICCYQLARERFGIVTSVIASLGVAAGSGVAWYAVSSADQTGAVRFLLGSVTAWVWMRVARGRSHRARWACAAAGVVAGVAAALPWVDPQPFAGSFSVADVLWSSRGGLLATSPAVCLSVMGLFVLLRVDRVLAVAALSLLTVLTLWVSAHASWWTFAWPAPPAFVSLAPYFACGAAALIDAIGRGAGRRPVLAAGVLLAPLVLWNFTLMKAGADASFHLGEPMSFGDVGAAQTQALHGWIGHPPSMPANLAFALANGVRPSAYDLLASNRLLAGGAATGEIDIGERDTPFVGDGWHGAERDGGRSFRWATRAVTVLAPLDHVADLVVDVVVRPYQPPNHPPQQLTLVVNGVAQAPVALAAGWHPATFHVARSAWRSGVNHLELRFAYDAKPSDAGIPDGRSLASSVDAISVRVAH